MANTLADHIPDFQVALAVISRELLDRVTWANSITLPTDIDNGEVFGVIPDIAMPLFRVLGQGDSKQIRTLLHKRLVPTVQDLLEKYARVDDRISSLHLIPKGDINLGSSSPAPMSVIVAREEHKQRVIRIMNQWWRAY